MSSTHPKIALWRNISASHSRNLAGMFYTTLYRRGRLKILEIELMLILIHYSENDEDLKMGRDEKVGLEYFVIS